MYPKYPFLILDKFRFSIFSKIRDIYLSSSFYNQKISKIIEKNLVYKPNPNIVDCIIKFNKKKINIEDFSVSYMWDKENINDGNYIKLHNFFWLFSINLKSSNKIIQSVIEDWIDRNKNYKSHNWDLDVLSKRVISLLCNSKITYEDSALNYKRKFNFLIRKQINHLTFQIEKSKLVDDKIIGCSAIILAGLCYNDEDYLKYGFKLLKKIISFSLDNNFFPKSRSVRQLIFYLKYYIFIRELLKDSNQEIPDYLNETIFYLGQGYKLLCQSINQVSLFNGNQEMNIEDFNSYLKKNGYEFKDDINEAGGYALLKDKKTSIVMDLGKPPEKKFSQNYQSGPLSFEFNYLGKKLICNSGYFQNTRHQLNIISKSTVAQSTVIIDNRSVSKFRRYSNGIKLVDKSFKIFNKKINFDKNKWILAGSHDGYYKTHGIIHQREIEYFPNDFIIRGNDYITRKNSLNNPDFEIRFHFHPDAKLTKTIDGKSILIQFENSGWKFICEDNIIGLEAGLYFGIKNLYIENQNIYIEGKINNNKHNVYWEFKKI
tara:strand:+ start:1409 stop:3037 length:1629 start_codon:yes stop_codon:yes gene_type:complete